MSAVNACNWEDEIADLQDVGQDNSVEHDPGGKEGSEQSFTTRKIPDPESQCHYRNSCNNETGDNDG